MDRELERRSWEVVRTKSICEHPFVSVAIEQVQLPNGDMIADWPKIYTKDYVNALVLNEAREVLVLEGYKHGTGWSSWQMLGGYLEEGEDPLTTVQRELLEETGYATEHWSYLGSYVVDPNRHVGIGHFFCAQFAKKVAEPNNPDLEEYEVKWVPLQQIRYALLDGRIAVVSYALTITLSLLTIL